MCTNQKSLQKSSNMTTLIRPKSDPYIPMTLLSTAVTKNVRENRNRETRSFDDLTASIPPSSSTSSLDDCSSSLNGNNHSEGANFKKNIVKTCKNCSYTFHVKSLTSTPMTTPMTTPSSSCSNSSKSYSPSPSVSSSASSTSDEFCCKDCETCYTLFNAVTPVNTTPSKPIVKQSTFDIRQSIYAFQQQLLLSENQDLTSEDSTIEDTAVTTISHNEQHDRQQQQLHQVRNQREQREEDPKELLKAAKKEFNVQYFQTLKQEKRQVSKPIPQPSSANNLVQDPVYAGRGNGNVFGWFFNQPKPVRPQLHAFI
mmetsp:Transcript_15714/g.17019  ORF Transcript_15714/g.17019 Transcript_15714/m.17019 type:complete len:312 (-) Transcript_15714:1004-1939(-)